MVASKTTDNTVSPNVKAIRDWLVMVLGALLVVWGMLMTTPSLVMIGFSVLGAGPVWRAQNGGL